MSSLTVTVAPNLEPIILTEAKAWLRITSSDDDVPIGLMIKSARQWIESYLKRALITQTIVWRLDCGLKDLFVPLGKLQSVSSITYLDEDGASQTLATSVYDVDIYSDPGKITLAYDQTYPSTRVAVNNVTITFVAGYGTPSASIPEVIRHCCLQLIHDTYEHRGTVTQMSLNPSPGVLQTIQRALFPYRINIF
jgi:uncharacterized phiE125 gp8 family phage protein